MFSSFDRNFSSLSLDPSILKTLDHLQFKNMTLVQEATLPVFLTSKDVIVEAVTGSGKTLCFLVPILQFLIKNRHDIGTKIASIIIAPTRELAEQITKVLDLFLNNINDHYQTRLSSQLIIGGSSVEFDLSKTQKNGANVIVGTPGRLQELFTNYPYLYNTKNVEILVMDEADRLLDMGFETTLNSILSLLPKQRKTGLFSATMSESLDEWSRVGLRNPVRITKTEYFKDEKQRIPTSLKIYYTITTAREKWDTLEAILRENSEKKIILYVATCAVVDYYFKVVGKWDRFKEFNFYSLHGKMDPKRRGVVYEKFSSAKKSVLICTDIAARGLDFPDIDYVIQYDPPQDPKSFSHRCGRTARIGKEGAAVVFLDPKEDTFVEFLKIRKVPMEPLELDLKELEEEKYYQELVEINQSDRDIYEKSIKAFVSWIRYYNEHQANFIFNLKKLDLAQVAKTFGLFRLPKMPELSKVEFTTLDIDPDSIPYLDKIREKNRLKNLTKPTGLGLKSAKKHKSVAWSQQKQIREKRIDRKEKREKRKIAKAKSSQVSNDLAAKKNSQMEDWLEMQSEARKLKKSAKSNDYSDDDL
jgi:ATP-dependent RNA helicase DDX55/SPB4